MRKSELGTFDFRRIMNNIAKFLQQNVSEASKSFFAFFRVLLLGIIAAVLLIIPITLRIAAILAWLIGAFLAITATQSAYIVFSKPGEVIVLQFALIVSMLVIALLGLMNQREKVWGALALGGAIAFGVARGVNMLTGSGSGELALHVLPPALLAVGMLTSTIRLRSIRKSAGKIEWSAPAFQWLNKFVNAKGGDEQSPE